MMESLDVIRVSSEVTRELDEDLVNRNRSKKEPFSLV